MRRIFRDRAFWTCIVLTFLAVALYLTTCPAENAPAKLQTLILFETAVLVMYYLAETRRVRIATEHATRPFLVPTADMGQITLRNLGTGAAANVRVRDLGATKWETAVTAMSAAPQGQAKLGAPSQHALHESVIDKVRLSIECEDAARGPKVVYRWIWQGDKAFNDKFRLETTDHSI